MLLLEDKKTFERGLFQVTCEGFGADGDLHFLPDGVRKIPFSLSKSGQSLRFIACSPADKGGPRATPFMHAEVHSQAQCAHRRGAPGYETHPLGGGVAEQDQAEEFVKPSVPPSVPPSRTRPPSPPAQVDYGFSPSRPHDRR